MAHERSRESQTGGEGAKHLLFTCLLGALLLIAGCANAPTRQSLTVFAAASLTDAMEALVDSFEVAHPQIRVNVSVAATSLLARQIEQGAPADVFFSANTAWMDELVAQGRVAGGVRYPLSNRLVVVQRTGTPPIPSVQAMASLDRLALADPEHVPAGLYAKQALMCENLWDTMQLRVVPMLDVRAALLALRHGAADAAIVYASDLFAGTNVEIVLEWPGSCHPAIRYAAAQLVTAPHPAAARAFLDFATDAKRAALWRSYGFEPLVSEDELRLQDD